MDGIRCELEHMEPTLLDHQISLKDVAYTGLRCLGEGTPEIAHALTLKPNEETAEANSENAKELLLDLQNSDLATVGGVANPVH